MCSLLVNCQMMKIDMNLKCSLNDVHDHIQQTRILAAMINKFESFLVNDSHTSCIQNEYWFHSHYYAFL